MEMEHTNDRNSIRSFTRARPQNYRTPLLREFTKMPQGKTLCYEGQKQ